MPCAADPAEEVAHAVAELARGGLVAFPTETVWGIAAAGDCASAVARLRRFKGRDAAQPISLLVPDAGALALLGCEVDARAEALMASFWPGPLTLVLPCRSARLAEGLINEQGGLGIRCSPHPVAAALARAAAEAGLGPLTATSCNVHGEPAAATREQARAVCKGGLDAPWVVASGEDAHAAEVSTVLDLCSDPPRVLRLGAISERAIDEALVSSGTRARAAGTPGRG